MFEGKVVLITGAAGAGAGGSGKAAAYRFAADGAKVVLIDINKNAGVATEADMRSKGYDALFVHCDISDEGMVKNAVARQSRRMAG